MWIYVVSTLKPGASKKETSIAKQSSSCGESERECFGFNVTLTMSQTSHPAPLLFTVRFTEESV